MTLLWEHRLGNTSWLVVIFYVTIALICILGAGYLLYFLYDRLDKIPYILLAIPIMIVMLRFATGIKEGLYLQNARYAISESHLHFWHGYFRAKETLIPIDQIKDIHVIRYTDEKQSTIYFITDPRSAFCGYDFEKGENRHWPSFEMVEDPDHVLSLIKALRKDTQLALQ